MEELLESEVVWPENLNSDTVCYNTAAGLGNQHARATKYGNVVIPSTPIAIPGSSSTGLSHAHQGNVFKEEYYTADNRVPVPPHVLVSHRIRNTGNLAFPLCSGQGRTLKGRDLREVRSAVWRMTGFIDG